MSANKYGLILILLSAWSCSYQASDFDEIAGVEISDDPKYIQLEPTGIIPSTCFLFYPGGLVEPESYIAPLQTIAETGCRVIILKATADLAIFNVGRASKVSSKFDDIEHWIIGGHSLGGVVAVKAILNAPDDYEGLVLMASYPAENDDLSDWDGTVLSLSAENDGLTLPEDIEAGKKQLPEALVLEREDNFPAGPTSGTTLFFEIAGGNHGQFGNYGIQKDDGVATITRAEQHQLISQLIHRFFIANGWTLSNKK